MALHRILAASLAILTCMGQVGMPLSAAPLPAPPLAQAPVGQFDLMTYNVKGLPWPIARDRPEDLAAIGAQLANMRLAGRQPQVVVLQEAFVDEAKRIGMLGGYRYVLNGNGADDAKAVLNPIDARYAAAADWTRGEGPAPVLDSGLVILSDYPIVRHARMAFPQGACAGFDCLAAKGVLVAWIALPGHAEPVAVATTHLNSRTSAGVPNARSDIAFAWQWRALRAFLARELSAGDAAIFAGDVNFAGSAVREVSALAAGLALPDGRDAVAETLAANAVATRDLSEAREVRAANTDRQLYRSSAAIRLTAASLAIHFPETATADPLSDHPGFVIRYRVSSRP